MSPNFLLEAAHTWFTFFRSISRLNKRKLISSTIYTFKYGWGNPSCGDIVFWKRGHFPVIKIYSSALSAIAVGTDWAQFFQQTGCKEVDWEIDFYTTSLPIDGSTFWWFLLNQPKLNPSMAGLRLFSIQHFWESWLLVPKPSAEVPFSNTSSLLSLVVM